MPAGRSHGRVLRHLRRALIGVSRSWPQRAATRGIRGGTWRTHAAAVCGQLVVSTPAASFARTVPDCLGCAVSGACRVGAASMASTVDRGKRAGFPPAVSVLSARVRHGRRSAAELARADRIAGSRARCRVGPADRRHRRRVLRRRAGRRDLHGPLDTRVVAHPSRRPCSDAAPSGRGAPTAARDTRVVGRVRHRCTGRDRFSPPLRR